MSSVEDTYHRMFRVAAWFFRHLVSLCLSQVHSPCSASGSPHTIPPGVVCLSVASWVCSIDSGTSSECPLVRCVDVCSIGLSKYMLLDKLFLRACSRLHLRPFPGRQEPVERSRFAVACHCGEFLRCCVWRLLCSSLQYLTGLCQYRIPLPQVGYCTLDFLRHLETPHLPMRHSSALVLRPLDAETSHGYEGPPVERLRISL